MINAANVLADLRQRVCNTVCDSLRSTSNHQPPGPVDDIPKIPLYEKIARIKEDVEIPNITDSHTEVLDGLWTSENRQILTQSLLTLVVATAIYQGVRNRKQIYAAFIGKLNHLASLFYKSPITDQRTIINDANDFLKKSSTESKKTAAINKLIELNSSSNELTQKEFIEILTHTLNNEFNPISTRLEAALELIELNQLPQESGEAVLVESLNNKFFDPQYKAKAAKALGKLFQLSDAALSALNEALENPSLLIRAQAALALIQQRKLQLEDKGELILCQAINDPSLDQELRVKAIDALIDSSALLNTKDVPNHALNTLTDALKSDSQLIQVHAALGLSPRDDFSEVVQPILRDALSKESLSEELRAKTAEALGKQAQLLSGTEEVLEAALDSESQLIPVHATLALIQHGKLQRKDKGELILCAAINHRELPKELRAKAIDALITLIDPAQFLNTEDNSNNALNTLTEALKSDAQLIQVHAALGLSPSHGFAELVQPILKKALNQENLPEELRAKAAEALGKQAQLSNGIEEALAKALNSASKLISVQATLALIQHENLPPQNRVKAESILCEAINNSSLPEDLRLEAINALIGLIEQSQSLAEDTLKGFKNTLQGALQSDSLAVQLYAALVLGGQQLSKYHALYEPFSELAQSILNDALNSAKYFAEFQRLVNQELDRQIQAKPTRIPSVTLAANLIDEHHLLVRLHAALVLNQNEESSSTIQPITKTTQLIFCKVLENRSLPVEFREKAVELLGQQSHLVEDSATTLKTTLANLLPFLKAGAISYAERLVGIQAALALSRDNRFSKFTQSVFAKGLEDKALDEEFKEKILAALRKQQELLKDENLAVVKLSGTILADMELNAEILAALGTVISAGRPESDLIKTQAALMLSRYGSSEPIQLVLSTNLSNQELPEELRIEAAEALKGHELYEATLSNLDQALEGALPEIVRKAVERALISHGRLQPKSEGQSISRKSSRSIFEQVTASVKDVGEKLPQGMKNLLAASKPPSAQETAKMAAAVMNRSSTTPAVSHLAFEASTPNYASTRTFTPSGKTSSTTSLTATPTLTPTSSRPPTVRDLS